MGKRGSRESQERGESRRKEENRKEGEVEGLKKKNVNLLRKRVSLATITIVV